jgi:PAS domain S-box-containing protein
LFELHEFAFFVLGAAAFVLPRRDLSLRLAPSFWLLGTFGIAQGLFGFFESERRFRAAEPIEWNSFGTLCATVGYLALLEFGLSTFRTAPGARRLPPWLVLASALVSSSAIALLAADPLLGLATGVACLIGLPAALLTGAALFVTPHGSAQMHRGMAAALRISGGAFIVYGLLAPVAPAHDPKLPAWLPTEAAFQAATGASVEVVRGLAALSIAVAFVVLMRQASFIRNADLVRVLNTLDGFVYRCQNDRDWTALYMTSGVEELCGYRADEFFGARRQTWGGLIDSLDAERVWSDVQAALEAHQGFELSYRIRARDGTYRWVRERGRGVFDASGKLLFLDGHVTNDTRRMRTLADLRTLNTAIASSLNAVALADLDGTIRYVNRAFVELWRLRQAEDALGKPATDFLADAAAAKTVTASLRRERTWQGLLKAQRADGSSAILHVLAQVIIDAAGEPTGTMASFIDISEQLRLADELRVERDFATNLIATAPVIILLLDPEGRIKHINAYGASLLGYTLDELVGKQWVPNFIPAPDQARVQRLLESASSGIQTRNNINAIVRRGGELREIEWSDQLMRDARGQTTGLLAVGVDVTEQRALERQRLQLEAELRQSQKLEALGTLAGGIAHDFNNVLLAIFGNAELARASSEDRAIVSESLTEIEKAARRARELVQRILAFSRRQEHTLEHISLRPVVEDALKLLRSTLPARIELQLKTCDEDVPVMADASQVHQVIMNLTTNAWHAIGDKPGKVTVTIDVQQIEPGHLPAELQPGRYVRIDVADSGSGIPPEIMDRVFEPFFTTKRAGEGTGLGLAVAHGIMKAHGGGITVESTPGGGSTFHLFFPAAQAEVVCQEAPTPQLYYQGAGEHVLYVDDEQMLVAIGTRMLERMGYRTTGETSGERALAAFRANVHDFDVVVTDHNMPGMSGIELAKEIAKLSPETPIVLVSGFLREDELQRTLDLGVAEVVMKPTTYEHLGSLIRAVLDQRRAKQRAQVA